MSIGKELRLVDTLKHLIALDFDAMTAYQAAIDRLASPRYRRALKEFMTDHWRHTQQLTPIVEELGDIAPTRADAKRILTKGRVLLGQLAGDRGILIAMHSNEEGTHGAYAHASARPDLPLHIREMLQNALSDELRHRTWIERTLGQKKPLPISHSTTPFTT
jgi:rubrerythrin